MLIKRNSVLMSACQTVKKSAALVVTISILAAAAVAPSASASEGPLVDVRVSVTFSMSDLRSEDGTEKVYDKLTRKAVTSCSSDRKTLRYLDQTVEECAADLVAQFVADADIIELTHFHSLQLADAGTVLVASLD